MSTGEMIAAMLLASMAAGYAWLLGYGRGVDSERLSIIKSLRFSAALSRANGKALKRDAYVKADALDEYAERLERRAPMRRGRR